MEAASVAETERATAGALTPAVPLAGPAGLLEVLRQRCDWLVQAQAVGVHLDRVEPLDPRAARSLPALRACILVPVAVCALVATAFVAQLHALRAGPAVTGPMPGALAMLATGLCRFIAEATLARADLPRP